MEQSATKKQLSITKKQTSAFKVFLNGVLQEGTHKEESEAIEHAVNLQLANHAAELVIKMEETIVFEFNAADVPEPAPAPEPVPAKKDDRDYLMELYRALDGDQWRDRTGWGSGDDLSAWHGIEVDDKDRVIRIDLYHNNLKGTLPASLGKLTRAAYCNLKFNRLTGPIPSEIAGMESLKTLILQGRNYEIGGTLKEPRTDRWEYAYHEGKHLSNTNDFSGALLDFIRKLSNLEILELANAPNMKGPIPDSWCNLTTLKGLYLSWCDLSGTTLPENIGNLVNLNHLYICNAQLEGEIPSSIENLTQLTQLSLTRSNSSQPANKLSGELPDLSKMKELRSIVFDMNDLDGEWPHYWNNGNFTNLNTLRFAHNNLTGTLNDFDKLPALESLGLEGNKLSGTINQQITQLPTRLQIMGLGWNQFSGELPQDGWSDFTQLKTLYLNNNNLSGGIPCDFWKKVDNPRLGICWLSNNKFTSNCEQAMNAVKGNDGTHGNKLDIAVGGNAF